MKNYFHTFFLLLFLIVSFNFSYAQVDTNVALPTMDTKEQFGDTTHYILEEVIITATRTLQKIIDIPYPVERISKVDILGGKNVGINEMLSTQPGVFTQSRYGNHDVRISIRGFGSRSNSGIRGVRILLDDIPESEPDGQTRIEAIDYNHLGSIEIVRGNASSLYTNSPGGVVNFKSDLDFSSSFLSNHNLFGSYDFRQNGLKLGTMSGDSKFLTTYSYRNYGGYRQHSQEYINILNSVYKAYLQQNSSLGVYLNYVNSLIKLPGSLTQNEYGLDPMQASPKDLSRDSKRITRKGRLAVRYEKIFGSKANNEISFTGYGTIKDFDRTAKTYRLITRYGIGGTFIYTNRIPISKFMNELTVGTDMYYQTGPISEFNNINGRKGDNLLKQTDETISNIGIFLSDQFKFNSKVSLLFTGRYDWIKFDAKDLLFEVRNANRSFGKITPKLAINYKFRPNIAAYASVGMGFDSPAFNEMGNYPYSSDTGRGLLNPDLQPQKSYNFEIGIKGNISTNKRIYINNLTFEASIFNLIISDEIVPFVVDNEVYYRNAAKSNRFGIELGGKLNINKYLKFNIAYTLSLFKYIDYDLKIITAGAVRDTSYKDNWEPSIPKHLFSSDLIFEYPISEHIKGFIRGNCQFVDKMYTNDANSASAPDYFLLNAFGGLQINVDRFEFLINGGLNNIFNKKYVAYININDLDGRYYEAGAPRSFYAGFNIAYRF